MMGIPGGTSGADVDMEELISRPIEELSELPPSVQAMLPVDIQVKLLDAMPLEKGEGLLSALAVDKAHELLAMFASRARRPSKAGDDDSRPDFVDADDEEDVEIIEDDDDGDDEDDEDEDDEDEDDEDEDDGDEDGEDDDRFIVSHRTFTAPVGKRVLLRSDFRSDAAYCDAVVKSMKATLHKLDVRTDVRTIGPGVKAFLFDKSTAEVDIDCHILCEYERFNYRIEFVFNVNNQPGRTPLIDYFCQ